MNYENLKDAIVAVIKQNGNEEITGNILQQVLVAMVNSLGSGYQFRGIATPETNPGTPDQRVFYLASATGTYADFGVIVSDEICALVYDTAWHKQTIVALDQEPTEDSGNLISSGAIYTALQNLADVYMKLVEDADEDHIATFDENGQVKDSGLSLDDVAKAKGSFPELFAGFAGNLVDTRSAGTRQGPFAFRQSGGDGVNYMRKILGRTEAWNNISEVASASGVSTGEMVSINNDTPGVERAYFASHKYYFSARITTLAANDRVWLWGGNRTIVVGQVTNLLWSGIYSPTSDRTRSSDFALVGNHDNDPAVTGTVSFDDLFVVDLTLEYGAGNEPSTVAEFRALHPLGYYSPASKLINNAATGLETTGFNKWDEEWVNGYLNNDGTTTLYAGIVMSKNFIPIFPNTAYYFKYVISGGRICYYDANKQFISTFIYDTRSLTTPEGAYYMKFDCSSAYGSTYNHDICINLSDPDRNGEYEPYWKREIVLGLDNLACHDENNNAVVVNGLDGVGTAQDEAVVENGYVTKIIKRFAEVDLGDFDWGAYSTPANHIFRFAIQDLPAAPKSITTSEVANAAASLYVAMAYSPMAPSDNMCFSISSITVDRVVFINTQYDNAATFKTAMAGVKLRFELATPKVLTLDNPIPALIEADNLGTERRLPEDTADNPQGPFESDSNYSISTANLVRKLSEL